MEFKSYFTQRGGWLVFSILFFSQLLHAQVPIVTQTNVTLRVMAANLTTGNFQRYEPPGLNILKGLKPDIVAIQEFNSTNQFGINTAQSLSNMVATTFGTNFSYFRETGYNIPNGIISRYPILTNSSWTSDVGDRGYAWAKVDLPGTNDLYVVSVHLKSGSSSSSQRASEAAALTTLIQNSFGTNKWLVIAGDMNLYSDTEGSITTFKTYLSDSPVPVDLNGDPNTNRGRSERYDRVLVSFPMTNSMVPVVLPSHTFPNGLVFLSTNYTPLSDVSPVQFSDSNGSSMQHHGVVKDFKITYTVTNFITVPSPLLSMPSAGVIHWEGLSNFAYTVQMNTNLATTNWLPIGTVSATGTNLSFTNISTAPQRFYRVIYP